MVLGAGFNLKSGNINFPINIAYVPSVNRVFDFNDYSFVNNGNDSNGNPTYNYEGPLNYPNGEPITFDSNGLPSQNEYNWKTGHRISIIIGFNVAFFTMHYLGLTGMPRRTHTYLAGFGWETWNFVATIGAFVLGIGVLMVIIDLIRTVASGKPCGSDPWDARTLEWSLPSPVPAYNFAHNPVIPGRDAWWLHKYGKKPEQEIEYEKTGPEGIHMPSQSWWPLVSSVGLLVVGVAMALHSAGVPYCGYVAIGGLGLSVVSFFLWALEGPGGYHLTPPDDGDEPQKVLASYTPEPSQKLELTH